MALQFLCGANIATSTTIRPGVIYIDTESNELWFDDPEGNSTVHNKIIDTDTFTYKIESTVTFPAN